MQALRSKTVPVNVADQSQLSLLHELCAVFNIYVDRFAKYPVENIAIQMIKKPIPDDIATILEDRYGSSKD